MVSTLRLCLEFYYIYLKLKQAYLSIVTVQSHFIIEVQLIIVLLGTQSESISKSVIFK